MALDPMKGMIAAYLASPRGREALQNYLASQEGQKTICDYLATPQGKDTLKRILPHLLSCIAVSEKTRESVLKESLQDQDS